MSRKSIQFITEILIITMIAVTLGTVIGGVSSVPVTNALLANQVADQQNQAFQIEENFGRNEKPDNISDFNSSSMMGGGMMGGARPSMDFGSGFLGSAMNETVNYVSEVNSAMDLTVVLQMVGIGLLLTLIASAFSVLFVMRYDPLKILANRD